MMILSYDWWNKDRAVTVCFPVTALLLPEHNTFTVVEVLNVQ